MISTGCLKSNLEERDFQFEVNVDFMFPKEFTSEGMDKIPVINQGSYSTCVSTGGAMARSLQEYTQTDNITNFSSTFLYGFREPEDYQGEGMMIKEYLKNLRKYGNLNRDDFPYLGNFEYLKQKSKLITSKQLEDAKQYRISNYFYIDPTSIKDMKMAIMTFGFVAIAIETYEGFTDSLNKENAIGVFNKKYDKTRGGHYLNVYGWDNYGNWLVRNSWGFNWGDGGNAKLPMVYPISEAWAVFDGVIKNEEILDIKFTVTGLTTFYNTELEVTNSYNKYIKTCKNV